MKWEKSGLIFKADKQRPWMVSHTAMPIPLHLGGNMFRIYFSTRAQRNNPQVGFIEIDITKPNEILNISESPSLECGPEGYFDHNGVYSGCIVKHGEELWMYYSGRQNGEGQLYHVSVGLAKSKDGGITFDKFSYSPIFQRNIYDPWLVSTPFVIQTEKSWRMWYLSGREIAYENNILAPFYDIRSAKSDDGINWISENKIHIGKNFGFRNVAAPSIVAIENIHFMFFSYIKDKIRAYQLGVAYSHDLINWKLFDNSFNSLKNEHWDENKAYPFAFLHNNEVIILYCGSDFGKSGLGFLKIQKEELIKATNE